MTQDANKLTEADVTGLLEQYGADPSRFPEKVRAQAEALLAASASLREAQAAARELDELLAHSTTRAPSADLNRRVAEIPLRHTQADAGWSLQGLLVGLPGLSRAMAAVVAAAALGFGSGLWSTPTDTQSGSDYTVSAGVLGEDEANWEEFAGLAFADNLVLSELDSAEDSP